MLIKFSPENCENLAFPEVMDPDAWRENELYFRPLSIEACFKSNMQFF